MRSSFSCRRDFGGLLCTDEGSRRRKDRMAASRQPQQHWKEQRAPGQLTIVLTTTFGIGFFGDAGLPISERILGAQASILAVSFCVSVLVALFAERRLHETELVASGTRLHETLTELRLLYENAPIGLAFLTPDCRYRQINRRLTEICGLSIADHIGKSVRNTVPQVADQVELLVQEILRTGEPITGIEVNGQRTDGSNAERVWITYWHPLKAEHGAILGINVAAEEITEQKRAKAALQLANESLEARTLELTSSLEELRDAQDRLVQTKKLASLGQLTAGIAHEIKTRLISSIIFQASQLSWPLNCRKPSNPKSSMMRSALKFMICSACYRATLTKSCIMASVQTRS